MIVLSRRKNESIVIGDNIVLSVVEVRGDKVRLGLVAPQGMCVHRQEIWELLHGAVARVSLDLAWLTWNDGTVPRLARAIAADGSYDALPILADALEEAGCANAVILSHCRSRCPNVRSSWVVDLILSAS